MRSQEPSAESENHILDTINDGIVKVDPSYDNYRYAIELPPHIQDIYKELTIPLTSPAAQQLLKSNFTEYFISGNTPNDIAWLYGAVEWRIEEDPYAYCSYGDIIEEYVSLNIKTTFGLTVNEYLDLTPEERVVILKQASKVNKEIADQLARQQREQEQIGKAGTAMANVNKQALMPGAGMGGLEEMLGI